jgi:hypothetical protein
MSNSIILGGVDNNITNSVRCTIINGENNIIDEKTNTHIVGNNITATYSNTFYVGCNLDVLGDVYCDNLFAYGDVVASYSSDERLKNNITPMTNCLEKVLKVNPVEFDWNEKQKAYEGHDIGLIAQDVKKVIPEIVAEKKNGYLGIKYEKLIPVLIGATQEQDAQIQELEKQVQELIDKSNC